MTCTEQPPPPEGAHNALKHACCFMMSNQTKVQSAGRRTDVLTQTDCDLSDPPTGSHAASLCFITTLLLHRITTTCPRPSSMKMTQTCCNSGRLRTRRTTNHQYTPQYTRWPPVLLPDGPGPSIVQREFTLKLI